MIEMLRYYEPVAEWLILLFVAYEVIEKMFPLVETQQTVSRPAKPIWPWLIAGLVVTAIAWGPVVLPRFGILSQPMTAPMIGLVQGWRDCAVQVNGAVLQPWADKYEVGLICGVNDPTADKYDAQSISVSPLHVIRSEAIPIVAVRSPAMVTALKTMAATAIKAAAKPLPGQKMAANITIWNEIVLFPTGLDLSQIHRLDDVRRYGGIILSRDITNCSTCGTAYVSTELP